MKPRQPQIATVSVSSPAHRSVQSASIRPSTSAPLAPFTSADLYFAHRPSGKARLGITTNLRSALARSLFCLVLAFPLLHASFPFSAFAQTPAEKANAHSLSPTDGAPRAQKNFAQKIVTQQAPSAEEREPETYQTETFQYVRASDLTSERNTQYTYAPARFDMRQLRAHLRYPDAALREGRQATIDVVVYIDAEGNITRVNYIGEQHSAQNDFAKNACDAVKKCAFMPAYRNGQPVHSVVVIPVKFVL